MGGDTPPLFYIKTKKVIHMFVQTLNKPQRNYEKSWGVYFEKDGWYFYDWLGDPFGPYKNSYKAWEALDYYATDYLVDDE
jgi:hypothetical protein